MMMSRPSLALFLLAASAFALAFALVSQFGFDLHPCVLCVYQRWPYVVVILLMAAAVALRRNDQALRALLALSVPVLLTGVAIAAFHVGVEQHWWAGTEECTGSSGAASLEELKSQILNAPLVRCDQIAFEVLGISMAGWNALAGLVLAGMAAMGAIRSGKGGGR